MKSRLRRRSVGVARLFAATCLICSMMPSEAETRSAAAGASSGSSSASGTISEEKVKAAFVMRFLNYVEWPPASFPQATTPYVIGVIGAPELAHELEKSAAQSAPGKRAIVVRRIGEHDALAGANVVLIGSLDRPALNRWLGLVAEEPVLLITNVDGTMPRGSMINFRLIEDRVRFDVALEPVEKAGLKLNSRLLVVAMTVTKGPTP